MPAHTHKFVGKGVKKKKKYVTLASVYGQTEERNFFSFPDYFQFKFLFPLFVSALENTHFNAFVL